MRYILVICLVFVGFLLRGQHYRSDTLLTTSSDQQRMDFLLENANLLHDTVRRNFGIATLSFDTYERNYRTSQVAQSTTNALFNARGIRYLGKKTVVSGSFSYQKAWQDSLSYFLGGLDDNSMPTYYFVEKAGKFERQTYRARAHVGHEIHPNWYVDAELDYTHHWATRSVDPRMDFYSMTWLFKPAISYKIGQHLFSVQPVYGKGTAQTNLSYKNSMYKPGDYPVYHYSNNYGYGTIQTLDTAELRQYDRHLGLNLKGKTTGKALTLLWDVGYLRRSNESTHDILHLDNYHVAQSFVLQTFHAEALLMQTKLNAGSIGFRVEQRDGVDGDRFRGQNYFLSQWEVAVDIRKNMQEQTSWPKEIGLELYAAYDERDDAASSHYAERQWMGMALPLAITKVWHADERLRLQLRPALRLPLKNQLQIPATSMNRFSTGIAYPEFYYYDVKSVSLESKVSFISNKIWKKSPIGFFVEANFTKPFSYNGNQMIGTTVYSGNNFLGKVGVSFYL